MLQCCSDVSKPICALFSDKFAVNYRREMRGFRFGHTQSRSGSHRPRFALVRFGLIINGRFTNKTPENNFSSVFDGAVEVQFIFSTKLTKRKLNQ